MTVCGRAKIRFTDHPTSHLVAKPLYNNNNNNNKIIQNSILDHDLRSF
jgi:hypothetical protein